jgi:hypothetical protein
MPQLLRGLNFDVLQDEICSYEPLMRVDRR